MAGSVFNVVVIGHLGNDPELKYIEGEKGVIPVCTFPVAVSRKYKGEEQTQWVRCTLWYKTAELANELLRKGSQVYVCGEWLQVHAYTNKAGEPAASAELNVDRFQVLGKRSDGGGRTPQEPESREQRNAANAYDNTRDLSDIPF